MGEPTLDFLNQTVQNNAERTKELEGEMKQLEKEFEQEIKDMRKEHEELKTRVTVVEGNVNQIFTLLSKIEDSTQWIKRTISKAIITAVIGGTISILVWAVTS